MPVGEVAEVNPDPRTVALISYAVEQVESHLHQKEEYGEWLEWAASWKSGKHSPGTCVDAANLCFAHKGWGIDGKGTHPIWHTLGQLCWGAKEACYSTPKSGWLVIRYIADAMVAFGIAFPENGLRLLDAPMIDAKVEPPRLKITAPT